MTYPPRHRGDLDLHYPDKELRPRQAYTPIHERDDWPQIRKNIIKLPATGMRFQEGKSLSQMIWRKQSEK